MSKCSKHFLLLVILLLMLVVPILTLLLPSLSGKSNVEFRTLQDLPTIPNSIKKLRAWPQDFEQFTSDRFPFRSQIIKLLSQISYPFGISISPRVMVGEEGWLFLRGNKLLNESRGLAQISNLQLDNWVKVYQKRKKLMDDMGIPLFTVIIPNKSSVYPQYIANKNFKVNSTITDEIVDGLSQNKVSGIIDLRQYLKIKSKSSDKLLYGKFNTHWNDLGAYYGYEKILSHIPAKAISPEQIIFSNKIRGADLSRLIGNEELVENTIIAKVLNSNVKKIIQNGSYRKKPLIYKTNLTNEPKALIFCDSFTNIYLSKFLKETFSESVLMHHHQLVFNRRTIERINPDIILYIIVERLIPLKIYNFNML